MSEDAKIKPIPIPDGFLQETEDGEMELTKIQIHNAEHGTQEVLTTDFVNMLLGGIKLEKVSISRSEKKKGAAQYEMLDYHLSYTMDCSAMQQLLDLVPPGPQQDVARKTVGRALAQRIRQVEAFQSREIRLMQTKDGLLNIAWRNGEKP